MKRGFFYLPKSYRLKAYRNFVDCNPAPSNRLVLKIANSKEELEACFKLLHEAYVESGFMQPHPSGIRATLYHALPTTTTLCAKYDDQVVGTLSLIRQSVLGFPMQKIFDLTEIRLKGGNIAEVSALAVHKRFRQTGGTILFPLLKFMYEYCTTYFDTRHLVIAVNPRHIEMYESLLFFRRLTEKVVEKYDFVNGAPAVGATLDLFEAPAIFKKHYDSRPPKRNLYRFFTELTLPNIQLPPRRFFTTNDPVLTPELLDHFFNIRTQTFAQLSNERKYLLHTIYDLPGYADVLPSVVSEENAGLLNLNRRSHLRFSVSCPATFSYATGEGRNVVSAKVTQLWLSGFKGVTDGEIPTEIWGELNIRLGRRETSVVQAQAIKSLGQKSYVFHIGEPDLQWRKFVAALFSAKTQHDLQDATHFLPSKAFKK